MGFEGTAEEFNRDYPIGTAVVWRNHINVTSSSATNDGVVIVNLQGVDDPVLLSELTVSPSNPEATVRHRRVRSQNATSRSMASSRKDRANEAILAAAIELSVVAKKLATSISISGGELLSQHYNEVARVMALSAMIEGVAGNGSDVGIPGKRVLLEDLVKDGVYITHFQGRSEEWSYGGSLSDVAGRSILVCSKDKSETIAPADYGLCAYDGGSGAWHPFVWTENVGLKVTDGRDIGDMVDGDGTDFDIDDEEVF